MSDTNSAVLAVVGGGVMGETIISGLIREGRDPASVRVVEKRPERVTELGEKYGIDGGELAEVVPGADTVLIIVKPQDVSSLAADLAGLIDAGTLIVCLAAGITTGRLEAALPDGTPVVRVMPNTPARVGAGMAVLSGGAHTTPDHLARTRALLAGSSRVAEVPEDLQDAVTAVSGSGPAYLFAVAEAMVEAGTGLGLDRATAAELVVQTLFGAATMLRETGEDPGDLRRAVSSPNGTTVAALGRLESHGLNEAFADAMTAARDRSRELSGT